MFKNIFESCTMYNKSITFPLLSLILLLFTACKDSNSPCISTQLEEKQIGAWVQTHNKTESEIIKVNPCYIKENSLHSLKEYFGFKPKTLAEENTIRNQLQADTNYTVATYYIDAQNGSDDNSGTSKDNAWNTIRHMQSQKIPKKSTILLKRGQTHWIEDSSDSIKFTGNNGYILVSAYGEGEMPIIEPKKNRDDIIWTNNNDGTWSTTVNMLISRMWINNKEVYKSIPEENEKIDKFYPWEIIKTETESKINLLSSINPNNQKVEFYQRENSILINKNG
ncbi:MAG: hypothetical protein K0U38_02240, partial [Epsilonproteobacteria bacterium]|nr:hypothetical protein [Campylobacterota bacterium]